MQELHEDGQEWLQSMQELQEIQGDIDKDSRRIRKQLESALATKMSYIVVIKTKSNEIWYRISSTTPLEAIRIGWEMADRLRGTVLTIDYMDPV